MSIEPKRQGESEADAPLVDASDSEINALVDEVLRSGRHLTLPSGETDLSDHADRLHARVIAGQMQRLAHQLSKSADDGSDEGPDDLDEWWFELDGKRLGPISLRKVRYLWEEGELTPDSLCWHEGFSSWVSLFRVSELAEALAPRQVSAKAAAQVTAPAVKDEVNWTPTAAAAMESANHRRLLEVHPLAAAPVRAANDDAVHMDTFAGTFATLPVQAPTPQPEPVPASMRGGFSHSLVSGLVAGTIVAAAVVGVRVYWPEEETKPVVVVVRDEPQAKPPTRKAEPTAAKAEPVMKRVPKAASASKPKPELKPDPKPTRVDSTNEGLVVEAAGSAPSTVDEQFTQAFTPPDELDTSEIFEVVGQHKPEVDACVKAQKAAAPELSGRLVMRWKVALDGSVSDVNGPTGTLADAPMVACLAKEIAGWRFPKHEVARDYVEVPFVF